MYYQIGGSTSRDLNSQIDNRDIYDEIVEFIGIDEENITNTNVINFRVLTFLNKTKVPSRRLVIPFNRPENAK